MRKSRQGVPYVVAGTGLRVVDADMNDVPADGETMGEVVMRGNNVMLGYFRDPVATENAFRGGWFHSGDLAVMHSDGYIELRDRSKDIIISGGENISSVEVERVLCDHPAVLEAAVIAVPHEKWGEVPRAHVTLRDGMAPTEQELIEFCRSRLAHFKCPKSVVFGPLPSTSTGKVRKTALRDRARSAAEEV
jgi:fatty-acyl-CoA synthase